MPVPENTKFPNELDVSIPFLEARVVCIDVDDTLTHTMPGFDSAFRDVFFTFAENQTCEKSAAQELWQHFISHPNKPIDHKIKDYGIDWEAFETRLIKALAPHVRPLPGAAAALRELTAAGFNLCPSTTNAGVLIKIKLIASGLVNDPAQIPFKFLAGGSEIDGKGKSTARFFREIARRNNCSAELCVQIGDQLQWDATVPIRAGFAGALLIDTTLDSEFVQVDAQLIRFKHWSIVPKLLRLA